MFRMLSVTAIAFLFWGQLIAAASTSTLPNNDGHRLKSRGKSIAIVSGLNSNLNVIAAELFADALREKSYFEVLSPKRVELAIPNYPINIKGPYISRGFGIETDYSNTETMKIKEMKERLGVDYLYVLWAPSASESYGTVSLNFLAQVFAGTEPGEIDNDAFSSSAWGGINCFLNFVRPSAEKQLKVLKETCDDVATEFADKHGMLKPASSLEKKTLFPK